MGNFLSLFERHGCTLHADPFFSQVYLGYTDYYFTTYPWWNLVT